MFVIKAADLIKFYTHSVSGRGYTEARTDTTKETNICLGIHRQTPMATSNPICLSRLTNSVGLLALSFTLTPHYGTFFTYKVYDKSIFVTTVTILI